MAVFLDGWGTLFQRPLAAEGAVRLKFLPDALKAVKRLNQSNVRSVLTLNQSEFMAGDGSAKKDRDILADIVGQLSSLGIYFDQVTMRVGNSTGLIWDNFSISEVEITSKKDSDLVINSISKLNLVAAESWLIGDQSIDVLTAKTAGLKSVLVETGRAGLDYQSTEVPDFIVPGVYDATTLILDRYPELHLRCVEVTRQMEEGSLVVVGGLSRSGKTTFSNALCYALIESGRRATVLSIDRWLADSESRTSGVFGRYDVAAISDLVTRLGLRRAERAPMTVKLHAYHKIHRRRVENVEELYIRPSDIVILEGTIALGLVPLEMPNVHRFFVDICETERKKRVIREYVLRGKSYKEAATIYGARQLDETPVIFSTAVNSRHVSIKGG